MRTRVHSSLISACDAYVQAHLGRMSKRERSPSSSSSSSGRSSSSSSSSSSDDKPTAKVDTVAQEEVAAPTDAWGGDLKAQAGDVPTEREERRPRQSRSRSRDRGNRNSDRRRTRSPPRRRSRRCVHLTLCQPLWGCAHRLLSLISTHLISVEGNDWMNANSFGTAPLRALVPLAVSLLPSSRPSRS